MTGNKILDCQEMFRHACTFCECADLALSKLKHDTADIGFYISPAVINSAFACEVFMKAILIYKEIENLRTHELRVLYEALPENLKEWIKQVVSCGFRDMWTNAFGFDLLDEVSNAFVEWRYSYEHDWSKGASMHIDTSFLTRFRDALREACCQLFFNITWEEYKGVA